MRHIERIRKSYTSINKNGRYYTLPQIPVFDENGLWKYKTVLFSKHGNLKQTIAALITESEKGLCAVEIAKFVDLVPNSSFLSRFKSVSGVKREKHQGRFIYLSDHPEIYSRQMQTRAPKHFASFISGSIDYTPHQDTIRVLIDAMDNGRICKITYKSIMAARTKIYLFMGSWEQNAKGTPS